MAVKPRAAARRAEMLRMFGEDRLVAIVRTSTSGDALETARSVARGGVRLIEITMTVPDATSVIAQLADEMPDVIVGAGTVLSRAQAEAAVASGARFLVSPCMLPELVEVARAHDGMTMLGTLTPTEILAAARAGSDFIKIFPVAPVGGPDYVRNVTRALTGLPLVATGNVELELIPEYLAAGCVGFGIAAPLTRPDLIARGDAAEVTRLARAFLSATRQSGPERNTDRSRAFA
jgi:2-dehydro-3-deoxyphosphogluconate aldolase/(4S)-4-hydroxy-2-oxoglutarate aldolase